MSFFFFLSSIRSLFVSLSDLRQTSRHSSHLVFRPWEQRTRRKRAPPPPPPTHGVGAVAAVAVDESTCRSPPPPFAPRAGTPWEAPDPQTARGGKGGGPRLPLLEQERHCSSPGRPSCVPPTGGPACWTWKKRELRERRRKWISGDSASKFIFFLGGVKKTPRTRCHPPPSSARRGPCLPSRSRRAERRRAFLAILSGRSRRVRDALFY